MRSRPSDTPPTTLSQRVGMVIVMTIVAVGLGSIILSGFATAPLLRLLQGVALFGAGTTIVIAAVGLVVLHLGGWREPEGDFDRLVERSERLARWPEAEADTFEFGVGEIDDADGLEVADADESFDAMVRAAIDELPLEFHRALEHVAIVISDSGSVALGRRGRNRGAYGMYQGDTVAHDYFTERILIFRDTLTRDFGHDPELLRSQVRRTLRHELAHHLGWGERGVRNLGL